MTSLEYVNQLSIERADNLRKSKDGDNFKEVPAFREGDTVIVAVRVSEGEKERIQNFKGIVIAMRGSGINKTFTIRKVSNGIGVERVFPVNSPMIQSISIEKSGHVRRAKLYYLRGMSEKKIRQKLS
ncbi:MAG: 50S ribosomal protein L19 [Candidatus Kapabacteria bacterium]|nr:50S ribosomal protein L19 [Ignavibacteriota bacterium]MCW5884254.1 50S ribosomal protein L19 [Candidatus Kapabacteria bacterium]